MDAVLLIGLPGSGKSSFYRDRFFPTHVRIGMDLLKTRHRERRFLELCLATEQPFVIDNTNVTRAERNRFLTACRSVRVPTRVRGYFFPSTIEGCLRRNAERAAAERVPDVAVLAKAKLLEPPLLSEGFDQLFNVRLIEDGFQVEDRPDEVR